MNFPTPLKPGVKKLDDGLYRYHGWYLRFNKMENYGRKWTAHYKKSQPVKDCIMHSLTLRGLIASISKQYDDLLGECIRIEEEDTIKIIIEADECRRR